MAHRNRKSLIVNLLDKISSLPADRFPNDALIEKLLSAWGNGTWPAELDYLRSVAETSNQSNGSILECGSGVTTLLASAIAKRSGADVYSFEHEKDWVDEINYFKQSAGLTNLHIYLCPLRSYGKYDWYIIPNDLPANFSLVICDGPPGSTKGGRFGLVPCMINKLAGATILLDDFDRAGEQAIVRKWKAVWGVDVTAQKSLTRLFGKGIVPESRH